MTYISFPLYPWQEKSWEKLQSSGDRLPHALLLHGPAGIGKVDFARSLAQALLCENPGENRRACGACPSCRWLHERSHPDFRMVRPQILDAAEGLEPDGETDADDGGDSGAAQDKPARRAPSKEIRIDQVAALADFINLGTHRGGRRVVLIYPARSMNVFAANALLKMLEEPPRNTHFLLVSDGLDRIPPTILSRCTHVRLDVPDRETGKHWLIERGATPEAADDALGQTGGAPLAALAVLDQAGSGDLAEARTRLLAFLANPAAHDPLSVAEELSRVGVVPVLGWLQRWTFDCASFSSAERLRYHPRHGRQITALMGSSPEASADAAIVFAVLAYDKELRRAAGVADHPLNAKLVIENLLMQYSDIPFRSFRSRQTRRG